MSLLESEFDDDDDDEENDSEDEDEDDVFAEEDVENPTMSPSPLRRIKSIDINKRSTGAVPAARKPEELREQYERIFLEYLQEDKVRSG